MSSDGPLACARCATRHPLEERFCPQCGMPLVYAGRGEEKPITDAHGRARKVKPEYTSGALVRVAGGRNQAEAELIQGILLEQGIPSVLRRTRGFDVPDFLAAGPRDVMVPQSAYEMSRGLLADASLQGSLEEAQAAEQRPLRVLAGVVAFFAGAAALLWALYQLAS